MTNDLIKGELIPEQQQAVLQAMIDIQAKMPVMIDLTVEVKRNVGSVGSLNMTGSFM